MYLLMDLRELNKYDDDLNLLVKNEYLVFEGLCLLFNLIMSHIAELQLDMRLK